MTVLKSAITFGTASARKLVTGVLQQGPMPKHVAIIMDGNRRFARSKGMASVTDGHRIGADNLSDLLEAFSDFGISELTVYIFSLENFKRAKEEVDFLMELFTKKAEELCSNLNFMQKNEIGFEIVGDYSKAPTPYLRHLCAKLMCSTKSNRKYQLNIAFAYTARQEIAKGLDALMNGLTTNQINCSDVDTQLMEKSLKLCSSRPVDILIRTGGDERVSDFMMWQSGHAYLDFIKVTWPEFSCWHLAKAIFCYQMQRVLKAFDGKEKNKENNNADDGESRNRQIKFLEKKESQEWSDILRIAVQPALP